LRLGHVVYSEVVVDYEGAKLTEEGIMPRMDQVSADDVLFEELELFSRNATSGRWLQYFNSAQKMLTPDQLPPQPIVPTAQRAFIASGEKLLADGSLARLSSTRDDRIRAAEKEGYGFATGAKKRPWMIIRGISDYGDPASRDGEEKDRYHATATNAAASFLRAFLEEQLDPRLFPVSAQPSSRSALFDDSQSVRVETALLSTGDKDGLEDLARFLVENNVRLIATPGVQRYLLGLSIRAESTWEFTHTPALVGFRGTLHPYLMACMATPSTDEPRIAELASAGMSPIALVVCNVGRRESPPHDDTPDSLIKYLAKMQVGVPLLLRWAIRQWGTTTTVVSPADYADVSHDLRTNNMCLSANIRKRLFRRTLQYVLEHDRDTLRVFETLWPRDM
jgi:hypothetical protein